MLQRPRTILPTLGTAAFCLLLTACALTPPDAAPDLPLPEHFSAQGTAKLDNDWWLDFEDPQLQALMQQTFTRNYSLQAARERLNQAEAQARKAGASLFPDIGASGSGRRTRADNGITLGNSTDYSLGLEAAYELDFWGRNQASREGARFDWLASRESLDAATMTLAATLANTWYALQEQANQLTLLAEQRENLANTLKLIDFRYQSGRAPATDVMQQQLQLEAIEADIIQARAQQQVLLHQLNILTGQAPSAPLDWKAAALPTLPDLPDTGLPATLTERRPDLRQAWFEVESLRQGVVVARADRLPRLTLTASLSTTSGHWNNLFDTWAASLLGGITAPLFDGGQRKAEADRALYALQESVQNYTQTVLEALGEVEDALVREDHQQAYLAQLTQQVTLATQILDLTQLRYAKGATDYLNVLQAQKSLQDLQRQHLTAQRQLIEYRIALHRALAGGWHPGKNDHHEPPAGQEV